MPLIAIGFTLLDFWSASSLLKGKSETPWF